MSAPAADVRAQVDQLRTDRLDGKVTEQDFHARMDALGPQLETAPLAPPPGQQEAQQKLAALKVGRLAGDVSAEEYQRQMEQLGPLTVGEEPIKPQAPDPLAEIMQGARPSEYRFEHDPLVQLDDDRLEFDTELRQAFSDLKIPARLGQPMLERIEEVAKRFRSYSPADRESAVGEFARALQREWGDDYAKRTEAITEYVARATAKHEQIGEILDSVPWLLADVQLQKWLWSVVEYQQSRS